MKDILIGKADIKELLLENFIYVDKTEYIYSLIRIPDCYFLSRPRRFGKSLLISTLFEIFSGNKELFKNCWIYKNTNYDWKKYPIIYLDFAKISNNNSELFKKKLINTLISIAEHYRINLIKDNDLKTLLNNLLIKLYEKYGEKVVILIDEYDKPILDNIDNLITAKENRIMMYDMYTLMKSNNQYIRFQFVTGITRFSKTSLFSGPNNLRDISMISEYNYLLGYTQEELEFYFKDHITLALNSEKININNKDKLLIQIKEYYNGYLFSHEDKKLKTVYNPFSILFFFSTNFFSNYWFNSATPTYLVKLLNKYSYDIPKDENNIFLKIFELEKFEIDKINFLSLLVQTGYLTIESYNIEKEELKLRYPNHEVRKSFIQNIEIMITEKFNKLVLQEINNLKLYLKNEDWKNLFELFKSFYATIPYTEKRNESWYATMFFQAFQANGFDCIIEGKTNIGRTDMVLYSNNTFYIIEFKYNKTAEEAINQIKKMKYYEQYLFKKKNIVLIGINFDEYNRNIDDWKVEEFKN